MNPCEGSNADTARNVARTFQTEELHARKRMNMKAAWVTSKNAMAFVEKELETSYLISTGISFKLIHRLGEKQKRQRRNERSTHGKTGSTPDSKHFL